MGGVEEISGRVGVLLTLVKVKLTRNAIKMLIFEQDDAIINEEHTMLKQAYFLLLTQPIIDEVVAKDISYELESSFNDGCKMVNI